MSHARIPAAAVGTLSPPVCVRHGRPASLRPITFTSRMPLWTIPLIVLLGRLMHRFLVAHLRKDVHAPAWPWCRRCGLRLLGRVALGVTAVLTGMLLAVVLSEKVHGTAKLVAIAVTLLCMGTGIAVLARTSRSATSGARVSRDGEWLELPAAHEAFLTALRTMPAPQYPMPAGWTVPAGSAPSALWSAPTAPAPTPTAPTPLAPTPPAPAQPLPQHPVRPAPRPAVTNGWRPPDA